jgi:uncharacterized protein YyaL (SSP411 family)
MPNHLINENSPYLLQHAGNPVDWFPWGQEALDRAKKEDKPIFLSIGYAACHWCHVMAHESFEDVKIAQILNDHFISIKVDREERPDLDNIYMKAVTAMTGQGGWPLTVFLSSDARPFYGGTYFPPENRHNLPSFHDVLDGVINAWKDNRANVADVGQKITDYLVQSSLIAGNQLSIDDNLLQAASSSLGESYDWRFGGWGQAPKFPQPMAIEFLLRCATRGNDKALQVVDHVLTAMSQGGMYDVVGGGFHRYSTDENWYVPHFEKMLYDNAQLAQVYLHASLLAHNPTWREVCERCLDFIKNDLTGPEGGFYSSLDADSDGEEGRYYAWTSEELRLALDDPDDVKFFFSAHQVQEQDPFLIRRSLSDPQLSAKYSLSEEAVRSRLLGLYQRLSRMRRARPHPFVDDKVIVSWNALALQVFSEASCYYKRPDYLDIAIRNAHFILDNLYTRPPLLHSWRAGRTGPQAFLEDYASLIIALLTLYQADPDPVWFSSARKLADDMLRHFSDGQGGFFDTGDQAGITLVRPKEVQDNATPSGNALAANALLRLSAFSESQRWESKAIELFSTVQGASQQYPSAFSYWLSTIDFWTGPVQQIALLSTPGDLNMNDMIDVVWKEYRPRAILAIST